MRHSWGSVGRMGELIVELIPSMLGLMVTPGVVAGAIMLLGTPRPFAGALAFMSGIVLVYAVIAGIVVSTAAADPEPLLSDRAKNIVQLVVGTVLLAIATLLVLRRGNRRRVRRAKRSFLAQLSTASPPFAFGSGLAVALINPNVAILIAGLAVVAAADTGHLAGAGLLVLASVTGIIVPVLWRALAPASARRHLGAIRRWISAHDRTMNIAMLVVFGTTFVVKGWTGL